MAYADVMYYISKYAGAAIEIDEFPRLAMRASAVIDALTYNRAAAVIEADTDTAAITAIKNATCAVAETLQQIERAEAGGDIASERVGEHSVTYAQGYNAKLSPGMRMAAAAKVYLGLSGLMYAGLDDAN